jgi:hypothetical protein
MVDKIGVAYVPLSSSIQTPSAPTKIDTPDYPDAGTAYAGYSKTLISGNQYKLNPQNEDDRTHLITFAGGETSHNLTNPLLGSKDYYVRKILIYWRSNGLIIPEPYLTISDGTMVRLVVVLEKQAGNSYVYDIDLPIPLKFSKDNYIRFTYSIGLQAGDRLIANFFGWNE